MDYEALGYEEENPLGISSIWYPDILAAQRAVRYGLVSRKDLAAQFLDD